MTTFHLTVVTPDGCAFEGQAERVVCRAIDGDLAILAKHGDYCTALGMGEAHIVDAEGSGLSRSTTPAPRPQKSAPKRFWPAKTSTAASTRWHRPASSARWCALPSRINS